MKIEQNAAYGKVTVAAYPFRVLGKNCSQSMKHLYHSLVDLSKSFPVYMVGCTWFSYQNIILTLLHYSVVLWKWPWSTHFENQKSWRSKILHKLHLSGSNFQTYLSVRINASYISTKETKLAFQTAIYPLLYFIQYWLLLYLYIPVLVQTLKSIIQLGIFEIRVCICVKAE